MIRETIEYNTDPNKALKSFLPFLAGMSLVLMTET